MVFIEDAFVDAWRSFRIRQGDDPAALPDPLGQHHSQRKKVAKEARENRGRKRRREDEKVAAEGDAPPAAAAGGFLADDADVGDDDGGAEGGFLLDETEEGAGGFLPDESADDSNNGSIEGSAAQGVELPQYLPLLGIPDALTNLSLPSNDETILKLFNDVAVHDETAVEVEGAVEGSRRRGRRAASGPASKVVSLRDFERVVEVLLRGQSGGGHRTRSKHDNSRQDSGSSNLAAAKLSEGQESTPSRSGRPRRAAASYSMGRLRAQALQDDGDEDVEEEDSEDEDAYKNDEDENVDIDAEVGADSFRQEPVRRRKGANSSQPRSGRGAKPPSSVRKNSTVGRRRGRVGASAATTSDSEDGGEDSEELASDQRLNERLSAHQRRQALAAFKLVAQRLQALRGHSTESKGSSDVRDTRIRKEELRAVVREVGEKIPDKEVSRRWRDYRCASIPDTGFYFYCQIDEMIDEGVHYFAQASATDVTRQTAKMRREAAAGRDAAAGKAPGQTLGIDECVGRQASNDNGDHVSAQLTPQQLSPPPRALPDLPASSSRDASSSKEEKVSDEANALA